MEKDERNPRAFPGPGRANAPYQFTHEELKVLKDCNRESFWQRCVPMSVLLGSGTYFGIKTGYLQPSPKLGATPKVLIAVVVGYFIGKFSYQTKCAEKLMQLPNSQIGEMLRQRRKGLIQESLEPGFGPGMSLPPFSGVGSAEQYSDLVPRNHDIDTPRPQYDGLDDSHRPTVDSKSPNPIYEEEMPPVQQHTTTYEELRQKNREEYQQKRIGKIPPSSEPRRMAPPAEHKPFSEPVVPPPITNQYGDTWG